MSDSRITIPVDLTNPGQFFACCGLLEIANRLWPGTEGWFENGVFAIRTDRGSLAAIIASLGRCTVANTMTAEQLARLEALSAMPKKQRQAEGFEDEKRSLESLRRESSIMLTGRTPFLIDWFTDDSAGGSRLKTWAGQQSVLDIATTMHRSLGEATADGPWGSVRDIGLPFNFDSNLGCQGSPLDVGFSFNPLRASEGTRITETCRPALEFLCFLALQRFRPRQIQRENRFVYSAWNSPLLPSVAAAVVCGAVSIGSEALFEFRVLYRSDYLKSFLPAVRFQGDRDE